MHPPRIKEEAIALIAAGRSDCEVALRLGVPRTTVRDWRRSPYAARRRDVCWRCWRLTKPLRLADTDYAELLAMYLGDGYISAGPRSLRLRITLDNRHPQIIEAGVLLLQRCFTENHVRAIPRPAGGCTDLSVYSTHLDCIFPQHGPGKKHDRSIELEWWQERALAAAPWNFIRGAIRTDGCAFVNRTGVHEYLSYDYCNRSLQIAELFMRACDLVGVEYRTTCFAGR